MNKGIVYIIGGRKYAKWTLQSVLSLRKNGGRAGKQPVHIHFLGDLFFEDQFNDLGCSVIPHNVDASHHAHRKLKSMVMQEIPFDRYVMIDADTFIQGDFYDLFDLIPENGVAGIEDGNFENHLQMAKFLFVTKHAKGKDTRPLVKEMLGVDYGTGENYPPYFNVGVIGLSKSASAIIGKELYPLLVKLSENKCYNTHDEQLPMNSIMHLNNISAIAVDPIFNYTRSRMRKNKKLGIHDGIKDGVKIIHNRHYPKEADWVNVVDIHKECEGLI
jgi:lipopolysaccharide biosynthesis glycosyltransferase